VREFRPEVSDRGCQSPARPGNPVRAISTDPPGKSSLISSGLPLPQTDQALGKNHGHPLETALDTPDVRIVFENSRQLFLLEPYFHSPGAKDSSGARSSFSRTWALRPSSWDSALPRASGPRRRPEPWGRMRHGRCGASIRLRTQGGLENPQVDRRAKHQGMKIIL
jgi:hypothetical protein